MKCSFADCTTEAEFAPKIVVPAGGVAAFLIPPASVVYDLPLCAEHCDALDVRAFLKTAGIERLFDVQLRTAAAFYKTKAEADYTKASVERVKLGSREHKLFKRISDRPIEEPKPEAPTKPVIFK